MGIGETDEVDVDGVDNISLRNGETLGIGQIRRMTLYTVRIPFSFKKVQTETGDRRKTDSFGKEVAEADGGIEIRPVTIYIGVGNGDDVQTKMGISA